MDALELFKQKGRIRCNYAAAERLLPLIIDHCRRHGWRLHKIDEHTFAGQVVISVKPQSFSVLPSRNDSDEQ
jgi:hypothetical protein